MDTRSELLRQAKRLFAARGYDAVSVQDIVEAASVTKPTLYHHFGSKRGLLESLLGDEFQVFNQVLREAAHYQGDLPFTLHKIATVFFEYAQRNPVFFRLSLALWFSPRASEGFQVVERYHREQVDLVETVFSQAVLQHGNMRGKQRAYAASFIGILHHYIGLGLNGYAALDTQLVEQVIKQFQHGIYS